MKHILTQSLAVLTPGEKKRLGTLVLLTVIISIADIAALALLLLIIDFYTRSDALLLSPWMPGWLFNRESLWLITLFFVFFSLKNYCGYLVFKAHHRFVHQVASRISRHNLLHYLEGSYTGYVHTGSTEQIRKISLQPLEFGQYVLAGIHQVITEGILVLLAITAILLFNAGLFLLLMAILLPPVILSAWFTKKKLEAARAWIKDSRQKMWQHLQESISGYVESNIYDRNHFFTERYAHAQQELNHHQSTLHAVQGVPARLAEVFAVFGLLALIAVGQFGNNDGYVAGLVTLGAFIAAAYKIIPGIARILNALGQVRTFAFTVNDLVKEPVASKAASDQLKENGIRSLGCRDIHFSFDKKNVLNGITADIAAGDFVGIQGNSGKGKTTFLNILLGFLSPEKGDICINHQPASQSERQQYWKHIAYVKQQPFIIHESVRANIALSENHYDENRLQQAIQLAGLNTLGNSMEKNLSEDGKNISGGQRQRIAIARALYKNADLYILDEPFSELDEATEETLLQHFRQLAAAGKIILFITHNTKSLSYCNKIISID